MAIKNVQQLTQRLQKTASKIPGRGLDSNVSNIAGDMMKDNGVFMRQSEAQGLQMGNRRGLMNSSMSVGAAQTAALDKIIPMASQESAQRHAQNMSNQEFNQTQQLSLQEYEQNLGLGEQDFKNKMGLSKEEYRQNLEIQKRDQGFQKQLSRQEYQQNLGLADKDFENKMGLSKEEYRQSLELQSREQDFAASEAKAERAFVEAESSRDRRQALDLLTRELRSDEMLARLDASTRETLVQMEGDIKERLAILDLDSKTAEIAADTFVSVQGQYQNVLQTVINNPDMAAADRNALINSMQGMLDAQVTAIEGLMGVPINFSAEGRNTGYKPGKKPRKDNAESKGGAGK